MGKDNTEHLDFNSLGVGNFIESYLAAAEHVEEHNNYSTIDSARNVRIGQSTQSQQDDNNSLTLPVPGNFAFLDAVAKVEEDEEDYDKEEGEEEGESRMSSGSRRRKRTELTDEEWLTRRRAQVAKASKTAREKKKKLYERTHSENEILRQQNQSLKASLKNLTSLIENKFSAALKQSCSDFEMKMEKKVSELERRIVQLQERTKINIHPKARHRE